MCWIDKTKTVVEFPEKNSWQAYLLQSPWCLWALSGKKKKKKTSVSNMDVALCINLFVIFEKEKKKKAQSESWVIVPQAQPLRLSFQGGFIFPRFFKVIDSSCG